MVDDMIRWYDDVMSWRYFPHYWPPIEATLPVICGITPWRDINAELSWGLKKYMIAVRDSFQTEISRNLVCQQYPFYSSTSFDFLTEHDSYTAVLCIKKNKTMIQLSSKL